MITKSTIQHSFPRGTHPRILVLTGGLIHLVHQLAVASTLLEGCGKRGKPVIAVAITGVLRKQPDTLAGIHEQIEHWMTVLESQHPNIFNCVKVIRDLQDLSPLAWDLALLNNQWAASQRQLVEQLAIPQVVICGDGLGIYYRCAREIRAILPSLLNSPISEPRLAIDYVLMSNPLQWHRPPVQSGKASRCSLDRIFSSLLTSQRPNNISLVARWISCLEPDRFLWLCSIPNLAHQWKDSYIPNAVLHSWIRHLSRCHGFDPRHDKLVLIDHPKAPPGGSFQPEVDSCLIGPYRPSAPLEVLVALAHELQSSRHVVVAGMTSSLFGVKALTGSKVVWLPLLPLLLNNPNYWKKPVEFAHRWIRRYRMEILTSQL